MESAQPKDTSGSCLQKESIVGGPVTCVSFRSDVFCWVARGPFLHLVSFLGTRKKRKYLVFPDGGTIHGVRNDPEEKSSVTAVFGGRKIALLQGGRGVDEPITSASIASKKSEALNTLCISDWIWDLRMLFLCNGEELGDNNSSENLILAIALANNVCEVWVLHRPTNEFTYKATRRQRIVGIRSITYSMRFCGWNRLRNGAFSELVVASGTVTNEILVWTVVDAEEMNLLSPSDTVTPVDRPCRTTHQGAVHCLRGHEGVIHSVKFDDSGEYLASTSDDRSVRLWNKTLTDGWSLVWSGWSHTARVWNVAFSPVGVVSVGEDGTARIWDTRTGSMLAELRVYNCQSLWSIDVHGTLALIGCNDGTAKLWDLRSRILRTSDNVSSEQRTEHATIATHIVPDDRAPAAACENASSKPSTHPNESDIATSETVTEYTVKRQKKKTKPKVKGQTIFGMQFYQDPNNRRRLMVSTRAGSLYSLSIDTSLWEKFEPWCISSLSVNAAEGSCIAIHATGTFVAVGTAKGDIVLVSLSPTLNTENLGVVEKSHVHRRVLEARSYLSIKRVAWLDGTTLVSFHIKGIVLLWKFPSLEGDVFWCESSSKPYHILNTTIAEVPTCFAHRKIDNVLLIGDSRGNIATFLLRDCKQHHEILPSDLARKVHKKEYVNDIICLQDGKIISVGNDGCVHYSLLRDNGKFEMNVSVPVSAIPGISHVLRATQESGEEHIMVAGYHGNTFLALDLSSGYELFRVQTGGRQRNHSLFVDLVNSTHIFPGAYGLAVCVGRADGGNKICLQSFFSKSLKTCSERRRMSLHFSVGMPFHGEPIFDACFFATRPRADYVALLSGSEDCTARISIFRHSTVIHSQLLPPQPSCIRAVCSSRHSGATSTLLVVCGGKMTVQFFSLRDNHADDQMHPKDSVGMDKIVIDYLGLGRFQSEKATIDHRVNAARAVSLATCLDDSSHAVVTGDSDGCIYLFVASEMKENKRHSFSGTMLCKLGRPILSINITLCHSSRLFMIVGTTDGQISTWLVSVQDWHRPLLTVAPTGQYAAHQMGANSISALIRSEDENGIRVRICSGGDDQSIAICEVEMQLGSENQSSVADLVILSFVRIDGVSASGIKGVAWLDANHVISVGYSQKLALWELSSDASKLILVSMAHVDVSDVNCFALAPIEGVVAVAGEGIEFMSISCGSIG